MTLNKADQVPSAIANGRYAGLSTRCWFEIRVDRQERGAISGDLQFAGPGAASPETIPPAFCGSFRTTDDDCHADDCPIEWIGPDGTAPGRMTLVPSPTVPNALDITLEISVAWAGQPAGTVFEATVAFVGEAMRVLGLEIETEEGVSFPAEVRLPKPTGRYREVVSVQECLREAGIEVRDLGRRSTIPAKPGGWTESDIFSELDGLMRSTAQAAGQVSAFEVQVLALSHTDRSQLLGLSFDNDSMPRQGVAVFVDTIRRLRPDDRVDRKIVATAVHEIGHALNLVHRFDHLVRRSTSTSFMTYDYRYRPTRLGLKDSGSNDPWSCAANYWDDFSYTFDADELRHLRHAGRTQIVPGGASFGSVPYWQTAGQPGVPIPNAPLDSLRLWLTPPKAGTTFEYGQPVFLTASLMNTNKTETIPVARHVLDIKAGQFQLLVRPCKPAENVAIDDLLTESTQFVPIMRRCFDVDSRWTVEPTGSPEGEAWRSYPSMIGLGPGESIHGNANLAYSSASVPVDPGDYVITPILSLPPGAGDDGLDQIVMGSPMRIRVRAPQNRSEELDAETMHRPDVRASLALGGSACLRAAADDLEDLRARRQRDNRSGAPDPIAAVLTRAAGIYQGRKGNAREAAWLLDQVTTDVAEAAFDPHTAEHTRRLADRYRTSQTSSKPISVVVDVWARPKGGGSTDVVRGPGFLVVQETDDVSPHSVVGRAPEKGKAWGVLAPATQFPIEVMDTVQNDIFAEVIVAPGDGLTQRISANRIDLVTDETGHPTLAVLALTNPFPADRRTPNTIERTPLQHPSADVSKFFDHADTSIKVAPYARLNDLAAVADESLLDASLSATATNNAIVHYPRIDEIATLCDWVPWCEPVPPPTDPGEPRTKGAVGSRRRAKSKTSATGPAAQSLSDVVQGTPNDSLDPPADKSQ